jgi:hypothetical protein
MNTVTLQTDTIMFDATATDAIRPAGLLNGIAAATESVSTDAMTAMTADLGLITANVRAVAGNNPVLVVMSPAQAQRFRMRMLGGANYGFELFTTSALADGVVVAIASNALVSAVSPVPLIEASSVGTVAMDDTPTDIVTAGTR